MSKTSYELRKVDPHHYEVIKNGVSTYNLRLKKRAWSCDCPARKACKHLQMLPAEAQIPRFLRQELEPVVQKIKRVLSQYQFEVCGSYRRQAPTSKDLDIIVLASDISPIKGLLLADGFILELGGEKKIAGSIDNIPVDIEIVENPLHWAAHLLYRTGPAALNIEMRRHAKEKGFTLNEHVEASSEEELFQMVDMAYIEPQNR